MLSRALAALAVAAILTTGVGLAHSVPVRHHGHIKVTKHHVKSHVYVTKKQYCCAPASNRFLQEAVRLRREHARHRIQHLQKLSIGQRVLNAGFISRFTKLGEFRLTSYTGGDPGQDTGRYTSSGDMAQYGLVAVPPWIPLGTYLYIPGYGVAKAADHGSGVQGMHIDLCFGLGGPGSYAYERAISFGTRYDVPVWKIPNGLVNLFS